MASPTPWTWVWVDSRSWWWTGRPGVLWFMGLQRVGHDWATELSWTGQEDIAAAPFYFWPRCLKATQTSGLVLSCSLGSPSAWSFIQAQTKRGCCSSGSFAWETLLGGGSSAHWMPVGWLAGTPHRSPSVQPPLILFQIPEPVSLTLLPALRRYSCVNPNVHNVNPCKACFHSVIQVACTCLKTGRTPISCILHPQCLLVIAWMNEQTNECWVNT